jgi:hypothetical protein
MPYTKDELKEVQFYQSFVSELRNKYLRGLGDSANTETPFRKKGILYSFEDIFTALGIENVKTTDDSIYSTYLTTEQQESTKTSNTTHPKSYSKSQNLEKIIDRSISELSELRFADILPKSIINGDVVTNTIATDMRKWLIENNQKRIFPDSAMFYGAGGDFNKVKSLTMQQINTIPDGEPVE